VGASLRVEMKNWEAFMGSGVGGCNARCDQPVMVALGEAAGRCNNETS